MKTNFKNIMNNKYVFSASLLEECEYSNRNYPLLNDCLSKKLSYSDNGTDVGSINYMSKSKYFMIKTKALNRNSFLLNFNSETCQFINPKSFINISLKKGDIIISKDSNVGDSIILDKDYDTAMLSSGLYKLPITENKLYILSYLKQASFFNQLSKKVPKGATIKHGKTLFLDCKIPFTSDKKLLNDIEIYTKQIIDNEIKIKEKENIIFSLIEKELNYDENNIEYILNNKTNYKDILSFLRLDSGIYSAHFKYMTNLIKEYKFGYKNLLDDLKYNSTRGQNLQVSAIGISQYSDVPKKGFYKLITSSDLNDNGTYGQYRYIGNKNNLLTIKNKTIMFSATGQASTSVGKICVFINPEKNIISNINSFFFTNDNESNENVNFCGMFLHFLQHKGYYIDLVGKGNGGSFTEKHFNFLNIPNFPDSLKNEISKLYNDFEDENDPGIFQLSEENKILKKSITKIFDLITKKDD